MIRLTSRIRLKTGMEQTHEFLSIFLEYVPGGSVGRIIRTHGKVSIFSFCLFGSVLLT